MKTILKTGVAKMEIKTVAKMGIDEIGSYRFLRSGFRSSVSHLLFITVFVIMYGVSLLLFH